MKDLLIRTNGSVIFDILHGHYRKGDICYVEEFPPLRIPYNPNNAIEKVAVNRFEFRCINEAHDWRIWIEL